MSETPDALSPSRRRLADAIRGPLGRCDVAPEVLYVRLRAGGVPHEVAQLVVEAFAREEGDDA